MFPSTEELEEEGNDTAQRAKLVTTSFSLPFMA